MKSSSKLEVSASDVRIGTNGALIDLDVRAFQFTLSNQGWPFISSGLLDPIRSFGFFSSKRRTKSWTLGEPLIRKVVRKGEEGEADRESTQRASFYSDVWREGTLWSSSRLCILDTTSPQLFHDPAFLSPPEPGIRESHTQTSLSRPRKRELSRGQSLWVWCNLLYPTGHFLVWDWVIKQILAVNDVPWM